MTLGVLPRFRRCGLATRLLRDVLAAAEVETVVHAVYLHVQEGNAAAEAVYGALGFTRGPRVQGYYRNLDPPDAFLHELVIRRGGSAGNHAGNVAQQEQQGLQEPQGLREQQEQQEQQHTNRLPDPSVPHDARRPPPRAQQSQ
jgi:hypothetical protein